MASEKSKIVMYCVPCDDDREFHQEFRDQTIDVRGEEISVRIPVLVCGTCGDAQPVTGPEGDAVRVANDEYRRRHNLLTGEEIQRIREQYALSREAFAAVLGMSPATLYRYEGGAIQDELHDAAIFACDDPSTMERHVHRRRGELSPLQIKRFQEAIAKVRSTRAAASWVESVRSVLAEIGRDRPEKVPGADRLRQLIDETCREVGTIRSDRLPYLVALADVESMDTWTEPVKGAWSRVATVASCRAALTHSNLVPWLPLAAVRTSLLHWFTEGKQETRAMPSAREHVVLLRRLWTTYGELNDEEFQRRTLNLISERLTKLEEGPPGVIER